MIQYKCYILLKYPMEAKDPSFQFILLLVIFRKIKCSNSYTLIQRENISMEFIIVIQKKEYINTKEYYKTYISLIKYS